MLLVFQAIHSTSREFRSFRKGSWANPTIRELCFAVGSLVALLMTGLALWHSGEAVPARFQTLAEGLQSRRIHWQSVLQMGTRTPIQLLIGSGLGTYPIEYRKHVGRVEQPISLVELTNSELDQSRSDLKDSPPRCMRLIAGEKIYAAQLLPTSRPLPWKVELLVRRSSINCDIGMTVCHQVLTQSCDCVVPAKLSTSELVLTVLRKSLLG